MSWFEVEALPDAIYRIREPALGPLDACHCWLIVGERQGLLIDAGAGVAELAPVVRALCPLPITLLVTHTHFDHIGGAHEFADRRVHPLEAGVLAAPTPQNTLWQGWLTAESFAWAPRPGFDFAAYEVRPAPASSLVGDGDTIDLGGRRVEILHAPGHSPGLVCAFDLESGALFSSDALYDGPMFFDLPGSDREAGARSITRLAGLGARIVHPGHFASVAAEDLDAIAGQALRQARAQKSPG
jgi:glyoxylase-like metal-dependent hydrolase (beta-lactamase superfamily II)